MSIYRGDTLIAGAGGPSRNIGEIVPSILPLTDAGLHLLDGSLISGSGIYSAFVTYIAGLVSSYPNLFVTEASWQTSVSAYGVCGKFVYDSTNNTVRLPKVTGIIEGTVNVSALGELVEAGLPDISGTVTFFGDTNRNAVGDSYNSLVTATSNAVSSGNGYITVTSNSSRGFATRKTLSASAVNSTYGKSNTVQPQTIKGYYYMVIANSIKTSIVADIDEIVSDLNLKAGKDEIGRNWVSSFITLQNSVTIGAASTITIDLSSYLPNDGYDYEILGYIVARSGSSTTGIDIYLTDGAVGTMRIVNPADTSNACGCFIYPISGQRRSVTVGNFATSQAGTIGFFRLMGYRRLSTLS